MDILAVIAAITNLITEVVKSQPPEVAAELWKLHLKDVQEFRKFFENVLPKASQHGTLYVGKYDPGTPDGPLFPDSAVIKLKRTRKGKKR